MRIVSRQCAPHLKPALPTELELLFCRLVNKIFAALTRKGGKPERIMIDATHLRAHRTAASLLKKGLFPDVSGAPKAV